MDQILEEDDSPTRELPDLDVNNDRAEEAKGGRTDIVPSDQISANFAKIEYK